MSTNLRAFADSDLSSTQSLRVEISSFCLLFSLLYIHWPFWEIDSSFEQDTTIDLVAEAVKTGKEIGGGLPTMINASDRELV